MDERKQFKKWYQFITDNKKWDTYPNKTILEKRWSDLDLKKGEWQRLTNKEIESYKDSEDIDIADELLALIKNAYAPIGGHIDFKNSGDVPQEHDNWDIIDLDDDPEPDAVKIGKDKKGGEKLTGTGHDGNRQSIKAVLEHTANMLNQQGYYAELSGPIAHIMITRYNVPAITDQDIVQKLLGQNKPIEWLGAHPEDKYPNHNGWYNRQLGSDKHMKMMFGRPTNV